MKLGKIVRRFLVPAPLTTFIYMVKYGCKISPKAEVELSSLLKIGKGTQVSSFTKMKASDGPLEIGKEASIGTCCFLSADKGGIYIGDYSMIGSNTTIIGNNYKYDKLDIPICQQEKTSKGIRIEENVWIGAGCVIIDGAHIGKNVIVTPNSVVSGKVPENTIVQGNPAKPIFTRR
ncbi:MAG: acyltransferase [Gammaproteobacteria bacterium]|nr:acyltransferase [Gammaproteobacteria bacterium]MDH5692019.1 acyltransferase [Gammaproteobacteria bacterium]